jgi:NAD(P)H dehydrogenase (quinone)
MKPAADHVVVAIFYYSRFGVVESLAQRIADGVRRVEGAEAVLPEVEGQPVEELRPGEDDAVMSRRRAAVLNQLARADALVVGGPGYFGTMASPLKWFFEDLATASPPPVTDRTRPWRHHLFRNKVGAAFIATATAHGGNEQTLHSILTILMQVDMIVVTPGQQVPVLENDMPSYGATAISGPQGDRQPSETEQESARQLGEQIAEVVTWLRLGWLEWGRQRDLRNQAGRSSGRRFLARSCTPRVRRARVQGARPRWSRQWSATSWLPPRPAAGSVVRVAPPH